MGEDIIDSGKTDNGEIVWRDTVSGDEWVDGTEREKRCACAKLSDGGTHSSMCSMHADQDPCLTMSRITGKRRKGTIRRGTCTNCGWEA